MVQLLIAFHTARDASNGPTLFVPSLTINTTANQLMHRKFFHSMKNEMKLNLLNNIGK